MSIGHVHVSLSFTSMESPANPYEPPLAELAAIDEAERTANDT
jgi:hypothetical protein